MGALSKAKLAAKRQALKGLPKSIRDLSSDPIIKEAKHVPRKPISPQKSPALQVQAMLDENGESGSHRDHGQQTH